MNENKRKIKDCQHKKKQLNRSNMPKVDIHLRAVANFHTFMHEIFSKFTCRVPLFAAIRERLIHRTGHRVDVPMRSEIGATMCLQFITVLISVVILTAVYRIIHIQRFAAACRIDLFIRFDRNASVCWCQ